MNYCIMTADYTFKNNYKETVVKTVCDRKIHKDYVKVMNVWIKSDEYECPCAYNKLEKIRMENK